MNEKQRWTVVAGMWIAAGASFFWFMGWTEDRFPYLLLSLALAAAGAFLAFGGKPGSSR